MLASIRLVQSYGRGTVDLEKFSSQTEEHVRLLAANIQAEFSFVIALVEALSIAAVIWLGVWLVAAAITVGTLVLFVLLLQNMFKPARKIVSEWYKIGKVCERGAHRRPARPRGSSSVTCRTPSRRLSGPPHLPG